MRASSLVLTVVLACAHGKRGGLRQKARRVEAVEAAEAAAAAAAGEAIDPLGYYRYRWQQPTDTCGTELHADYDGTRAWNWGLDRSQHVDTAAACCAKCRAHGRCNSWVFCPEPVCYAPDAHRHVVGLGLGLGLGLGYLCAMRPTRTGAPSNPNANPDRDRRHAF